MSFGGRGGMNSAQEEIAQLASMNMMMGIMKACFNDCITDYRAE